MKNKALSLFLCVLFFSITSYAEKTDRVKKSVTISVIIPCQAKHAIHLYDLLKVYEQQTVLPDEVVISISEEKKMAPGIIEVIKAENWAFPVKLLVSPAVQYAGQNRNIACNNATGDVFVCQDADDIPHPQRIEIIKYFFEHNDIEHLMHKFVYGKLGQELDFAIYDAQNLKIVNPRDFKAAWNLAPTNGNIAISRSLFNRLKWSNKKLGQDVEFNVEAYRKTQKRAVLQVPLIVYRIYLSSHAAK